VVLPDTTIAGLPVNEVSAAMKGRLGALGDPALGYRLQSVQLSDENYRLQFSPLEMAAPLDCVIVRDSTGLDLPLLTRLAATQRKMPGQWLSAGPGLVWKIDRRRTFRGRNGYGLLYTVSDQSRQTVQGLAAYDQSADGPPRLVGSLALDLPNVFGPLRHFRLDFRRLSAITQTLDLAYIEPRLPGLPVGLAVDYQQDLRDTLFVQREGGLQLRSLPGAGWSASAGIGWRQLHVTPHGESEGLQPYRQKQLRFSLRRERFDRPVNPTSGYAVMLAGAGGNLTGDLPGRAALIQGNFTLSWVAAWQQLIWYQSWTGAVATGIGYKPQSADFTSFGGGASVRGYREDHLLAARGLTLRNELRFTMGEEGRIHLLGDMAMVETVEGRQWLVGAGFGIVVPTGTSRLQLDVAWNRDDRFRVPKLHLRIINILAGGR
jgi:outer membrane protein assembly factor BamA